jgi:RNA polymerase sigma-70 factor, ECF subfamily
MTNRPVGRHTGMNTIEATQSQDEFSALVEPHRRELQLHCYRMLGSYEDSEDLVQETFLRAWRKRESYEGRSSLRAWLYKIATNACLDVLKRRPRTTQSGSEVLWLQPYPDELLEGIPAPDAEPDAAVVSKETVELAFLVAIQHLPPKQRAVLIVRDVLGWSAKETAALLEASVPSVNSALQRARATLKEHLPERRAEWAPESDPSEQERALLERYLDATERADGEAFVELMHEDARFSMPPEPGAWVGSRTIVDAWIKGGMGSEEWGHMRGVVTRANMQPAVACYVRKPGDSEYRLFTLDVLRIEEGKVAEIVTFYGEPLDPFDLPPTL